MADVPGQLYLSVPSFALLPAAMENEETKLVYSTTPLVVLKLNTEFDFIHLTPHRRACRSGA
jgi:hypothetical protein